MLFRVGDFTAMIAVILYALAPAVRYTAHGIKNINEFTFRLCLFNFSNLYKYISCLIKKNRILLPVPFFVANFFAFLFEKLSIDLLTREQLDLFKNDNLVSNNFLKYQNLGINPSDTKHVIKTIINSKLFKYGKTSKMLL